MSQALPLSYNALTSASVNLGVSHEKEGFRRLVPRGFASDGSGHENLLHLTMTRCRIRTRTQSIFWLNLRPARSIQLLPVIVTAQHKSCSCGRFRWTFTAVFTSTNLSGRTARVSNHSLSASCEYCGVCFRFDVGGGEEENRFDVGGGELMFSRDISR